MITKVSVSSAEGWDGELGEHDDHQGYSIISGVWEDDQGEHGDHQGYSSISRVMVG